MFETTKIILMATNAYSIWAIIVLGPLWFFLLRNKTIGFQTEDELVHIQQCVIISEHFLIAIMLFCATQVIDMGIVPMHVIYYYLIS